MRQNGFTLAELLIVVTLIGIIASITYSVLNQRYQQARARDAVNRSNLEQAVETIEGYISTGTSYPGVSGGKPVSDATLKELQTSWPAGLTYNSNGTNFDIYFKTSNNNYVKYSSVWGVIKNCTPTNIATLGACTAAP